MPLRQKQAIMSFYVLPGKTDRRHYLETFYRSFPLEIIKWAVWAKYSTGQKSMPETSVNWSHFSFILFYFIVRMVQNEKHNSKKSCNAWRNMTLIFVSIFFFISKHLLLKWKHEWNNKKFCWLCWGICSLSASLNKLQQALKHALQNFFHLTLGQIEQS